MTGDGPTTCEVRKSWHGPRLVLFDLMGTLLAVRERAPYWESLGRYLEQAGYGSCAAFAARYSEWRKTRRAALEEMTLRDGVAQLVAISDAHSSELEALFLREYAEATSVIPGVQAMLARWRGRCSLGVVSNFFVAGAARSLLERHRLLQSFDVVLDSAEVGFRKPHPALFERALARVGANLQPSQVLMIGDDWQADVLGARALGWRAAHFSVADEHAGEVPVIRSWDELDPEAWPW